MIVFRNWEMREAISIIAQALEKEALDRNGRKLSIDIDQNRLLADVIASVGNMVDGYPAYLAADGEEFPIKAVHPGELTGFLMSGEL